MAQTSARFPLPVYEYGYLPNLSINKTVSGALAQKHVTDAQIGSVIQPADGSPYPVLRRLRDLLAVRPTMDHERNHGPGLPGRPGLGIGITLKLISIT